MRHFYSCDKKRSYNAGFSLVELIIVVSILAIASVPLYRSLSLAAKTNGKAQSMQNATSLAESVMEQMKADSIDDIKAKCAADSKWTFTDHGTYYTVKMTDQTATQGEKFNVEVTIDKSGYSGNTTPVADKIDNVKSANTMLLPSIESINTDLQAVLSSARELNKYDDMAQSYFNEKIADYPMHSATIKTKRIDIKKTVTVGPPTGANVTAKVTYEDTTGNKFVRDLYTGTFLTPKKDDGSYESFLDSSIYIFHTTGIALPAGNYETIYIDDAGGSSVSHKIYFIRQVDGETSPKLILNGKELDYSTMDSVDPVDIAPSELITNLSGKVYKDKAKTRVYDITVVLKKAGDDTTEYAKLNSTVTASDEIP